MNFALPLVVVTCVAGVQAARRKQRPGFDANLAPVEKRQLQLDGWSAFIGALMMIAHQSSVYRRLGGLDNLQIVLLPLPGEVGPASGAAGGAPACASTHTNMPACINPLPDRPATAPQCSSACTSGPPSGHGPICATARWPSWCCG